MAGLLDTIQYALQGQGGLQGLLAQAQAAAAPDPNASAPQAQQAPVQAPAQQQQAPPQAAPALAQVQLHPTRDAILSFLGGAAGRLDTSLQQHEAARFQQQRMQAVYQALPEQYRTYFLADPQGFTTALEKTIGQVVPEGNTVTYGIGGQTFTAPKMIVDDKSGVIGTQRPGSFTPTGQLGGDITMSPGGTAFSGRTGGVAFQEPQFHAWEQGQNAGLVTPPLQAPSAPATGVAAPDASSAPAPSAAASAPPANAPRGVRNNNFGNVRPVPGGWAGQTGVDAQGYAIFATPEAGIQAADRNLQSYGARDGIDTLAGVIQRWAPPGAGNNPQAYTATVSKMTGISPTAQIDLSDPTVRARILPAIFRVENGAGFNGAQPARQAAPAAQQAAPAQPQAQSGSVPGIQMLSSATPSRLLTDDETKAEGFTPGTKVQRAPNGTLSVAQPPAWSADNVLALKKGVLDHDQYKSALNAMTAYKAMAANADKMNGPSAYAMLDTMARTVNPQGAVRMGTLQLVKETFGLPTNIMGSLQASAGKGPLPDFVRKQIMQAVLPFVQSNWDEANAINQEAGRTAKAHGFDPADAMAPLDPRPVDPDAPPQLPAGWSQELPPAQLATAKKFAGSTAEQGSAQNPLLPRNHEQFNRMGVGTWFINPADGRVLQKTH